MPPVDPQDQYLQKWRSSRKIVLRAQCQAPRDNGGRGCLAKTCTCTARSRNHTSTPPLVSTGVKLLPPPALTKLVGPPQAAVVTNTWPHVYPEGWQDHGSITSASDSGAAGQHRSMWKGSTLSVADLNNKHRRLQKAIKKYIIRHHRRKTSPE